LQIILNIKKMKRGILIFVVVLVLFFIATSCNSTKNCPAYSHIEQTENVTENV